MSSDPQPETKTAGFGPELFIVAGLGVALVAGLALWGMNKAKEGAEPTPSRPSRSGELIVDRMVGDRVCAECHPGESALFARSGHSKTLHPISKSGVAQGLDGRSFPDPELPGVTWTYHYQDGTFTIERVEGDSTESMTADYAFGSDSHATTFVSVVEGPRHAPAVFEHRLTHFAKGDRMGITPGQEEGSAMFGRMHAGRRSAEVETVHCFGCHSTLTSAEGRSRFDAKTMVMNVSCESCHGPGRDHVAAARVAGPGAELAMDYGPNRYKADDQMRLCGQCHRHPDMAPPGSIRPDNPEIVRFQPVGLMQSRCYKESRQALNCATCHDPHAPVATNSTAYDRACLKCHKGAAANVCPAPGASAGNCAGCHMPRQDSGQGVLFADHWIRIP
ncbi:MAG: multiheme c-type cytochrome [Isosphaeraceae bacterium]